MTFFTANFQWTHYDKIIIKLILLLRIWKCQRIGLVCATCASLSICAATNIGFFSRHVNSHFHKGPKATTYTTTKHYGNLMQRQNKKQQIRIYSTKKNQVDKQHSENKTVSKYGSTHTHTLPYVCEPARVLRSILFVRDEVKMKMESAHVSSRLLSRTVQKHTRTHTHTDYLWSHKLMYSIYSKWWIMNVWSAQLNSIALIWPA